MSAPAYASAPGQQPNPALAAQQAEAKRRAEAEAETRRTTPGRLSPPPHVLASLVPDSPAFLELMKLEQKLDWTLMRKKAEVNDALGKPTRVKRTLRVFVSNTAHDQDWQKELDAAAAGLAPTGEASASRAEGDKAEKPEGDVTMEDPSAAALKKKDVDVGNGDGIAGWILKIEGRLLDSGNVRLDRTKRKFTTFLKSAIIEFDNREAPTYPEGNIVEWHATAHQGPPLDGFEILRRGDQNVPCRITLHVSHYPERFKVLEPLKGLIAVHEATRAEVLSAVWKFVKVTGAQDKDDGTIVRPVGGLEKIFPQGQESVAFHQLPELASRYLAHPDPVVIPYTVDVTKDYNFHQKCFDIPLEMEDPLKSKMASLVSSFEGPEGAEVMKMEDKVAELAFFVRELKEKRDFLESFAANPQSFINSYLAAQARDLDLALGYQIGQATTNGGSVREEDLRRSDLFQMPWVDEAVSVVEGARMEGERRAVGYGR